MGTRHNNNIITTSKRRRDVFLMSKSLIYYCVVCLLGCNQCSLNIVPSVENRFLNQCQPNPDNIAEAAHQRAGSGSCGHPRRSRQRTGGESANWLCSGPAPAEPSLPPSCQQRAGSGPAPAPDSAGPSRIAAGLFPSHLLSIII